jgi:uncharacterized coiled-coil protein SlyX
MAETFYQSAVDRDNDEIVGYLIAKPVQSSCKPCVERHGVPLINSSETVLQRIQNLEQRLTEQDETINRMNTRITEQGRDIEEYQVSLQTIGDEVAKLRRHLLSDYEAIENLKTAKALLVLEIREKRLDGTNVTELELNKEKLEREIETIDKVLLMFYFTFVILK